MIHMCMDFYDLNKTCLKDNLTTSFIDYIVDDFISCDIVSFIDGFSRYNQIQTKPEDQHKTTFICPWGKFTYSKMPFG
jgi:putative transposase